MFKNYLLIAFRNLRKQKIYSLINITGLAAGMACFTLFAYLAGVKLNSDKFHDNSERIYGIVQVLPNEETKEKDHTAFIGASLSRSISAEIPGIEKMVRVYPAGRRILKRQNESFYQRGVLFVDSNFLNFFSFILKVGDRETVLSKPNSIVLSENAAKKYFGSKNPLGQVLTLDNKVDVTVTGITKMIKRNSSIRFECLISWDTAKSLESNLGDWNFRQTCAFVQLPRKNNKEQIEAKFPALIKKHWASSPKTPEQIYLFPLLHFRLKGTHIKTFVATSSITGAVILIIFGILLLFVVSINFINLSVTRYTHREKEIGLRKVLGANRRALVKQILGESLLLSLLAIPLAIVIYECLHPLLIINLGLQGEPTTLSHSIWNYPFLLKYIFFAALITGMFSGLYPAIFFSSFQPIQVLTGGPRTRTKKKRRGSKVMIVSQFSISILLIVLAGTVREQSGNLFNADLGYQKEGIAVLKIPKETQKYRNQLQTEISRISTVSAVTASGEIPGIWSNQLQAMPPGTNKEESFKVEAYGIDYDYLRTLQMRLIKGRTFSRQLADRNNFIINEVAAKKFQWDNPIGKRLTVGEQTGTVVGVVKDFLFADIGFSIPPAVLYLEKEDLNYIFVKFPKTSGFTQVHQKLKERWHRVAPHIPFECYTLESYFDRFFRVLELFADLLNMIGIIAVFFSCLGLLGLSAFLVEKRTKEIGIKKVLGASFTRLVWNLIKEFMILVLVSNVIAFSLVYIGWGEVLKTGLLYLTTIGVWPYLLALLISSLTALLAVTSQTLKVAMANPVDSLRYEG